MVMPAISTAALELFNSLGPWARADGDATGWAVAYLCQAVVGDLDPIEGYIRDDANGPGWSVIMDADRVPAEAVDFLGQFGGVAVPAGTTLAAARTYIKNVAGFNRGTLAAITNAGKPFLSGTKRVDVYERYLGDAYRLRIQLYRSQMPTMLYYQLAAADPTYAAVDAAFTTYGSMNVDAEVTDLIKAQKPAGIVLDLIIAGGATYNQLDAAFTDYNAMNAGIGNYYDQSVYIS